MLWKLMTSSGAALHVFTFFLTVSEISDKARQNLNSNTITERAALSWTCSLRENLHTRRKNFMLMKKLKSRGLPATPQTLQLKNRSDSSSQPFFGSAAQAPMHTPESARIVLTDFLLLHMLSELPQAPKIKTCEIFSTNCLHGLLLSQIIRYVPALFHCFCCRVGMVVQHFQINFEFKSNDRGEKGKKKGGEDGRGSRIPVVLAQVFPKYRGMPSHPSSQSTIRQQQTRGGVEFGKERAAAELGTVCCLLPWLWVNIQTFVWLTEPHH